MKPASIYKPFYVSQYQNLISVGHVGDRYLRLMELVHRKVGYIGLFWGATME